MHPYRDAHAATKDEPARSKGQTDRHSLELSRSTDDGLRRVETMYHIHKALSIRAYDVYRDGAFLERHATKREAQYALNVYKALEDGCSINVARAVA